LGQELNGNFGGKKEEDFEIKVVHDYGMTDPCPMQHVPFMLQKIEAEGNEVVQIVVAGAMRNPDMIANPQMATVPACFVFWKSGRTRAVKFEKVKTLLPG
jgi:hypothetical protein